MVSKIVLIKVLFVFLEFFDNEVLLIMIVVMVLSLYLNFV